MTEKSKTTESERDELYIPPEAMGPLMVMTLRAWLIADAVQNGRDSVGVKEMIAAEAEKRAKMVDHMLSLLDSDKAEEFADAAGWPDAASLSHFVCRGLEPAKDE